MGRAWSRFWPRAATISRAACGRLIELVAVSARDKKKDRGIDLGGVRWEDDPTALARADDIDLVVELIGGSEGIARELPRSGAEGP